jgi:cobalt-zinc-cadmium resistance protein CzcA
MLGWLVDLCTRRPRWVVGLTAVAALTAVVLATRLELDALPDITGNQVTVLTRAPGLRPVEVEQQVTRPVEMATVSVPGLDHSRSISRYGISSVTLVFEASMDLRVARQFVQERLTGLASALPPGVQPPEIGPLTGGLGEIFQFSLSSESRPLRELLELARYDLGPVLGAIPGVVEVNTWGGEVRTLDAIVDPIQLARRRMTLKDVVQALESGVQVAPGAAVTTSGRGQAYLRGVVQPRAPRDLAGIVLRPRMGDDPPVRLQDVASIEIGHQVRTGAASLDGRGEVVYVMLQMLRGANALDVTARIHERLETVRDLLPSDVRLEVAYDRSKLVGATLRTVGTNLGTGALLVVVVLFLLLGSVRAGVLTALMIPLSMLGALAGMVLLRIPGNLMSLGAIDFGLLVDGAVVEVESFFEDPDAEDADWAARIAARARSVAAPIATSVLIIVVVFAPILLLRGVDGRLFRPMAVTVVLALLTALVLAATFVPAASVMFLRPVDLPRQEPWLARRLRAAYRPLLARCLRHPPWVMAGGVALLALGLGLFLRTERSFVPQLDEGDLVIQTVRASDVSVEGAVEGALRLERALLPIPEVRHVASRIGSPAVATDIMGLEQADVFIDLAPKTEWRAGMTTERLIADMRARLERLDPQAELAFTQPIQMRFNELIGGDIADVTANLYGPDLDALREHAEAIARRLRAIDGVADVRIAAPPDVPTIDVRPRAVQAAQLGFTGADVLQAVTAVEQGIEVARSYDGRVPLPVRVKLASAGSDFGLGEVRVPTSDGDLLPLSSLAHIRTDRTPSRVDHHGGSRRIVVGFNVRGRGLGTVVEEAQDQMADLELPEGFRLEWGGQVETLRQAQARLLVVTPIALALVVGLLLLLFRDGRPVAMVLLNVPLAAVGGILALQLRGLPLSISASIGFIVLSGIAVLNGVVLFARIRQVERAGARDALTVARTAAENRLRPVLMTALTDMIGFLPMMLATGVGAEVQRPLATVVVGGLVTSTLLTLFILPAVYVWATRQR